MNEDHTINNSEVQQRQEQLFRTQENIPSAEPESDGQYAFAHASAVQIVDPVNAGYYFLRFNGYIGSLEACAAVGAVSAEMLGLFTEVFKDKASQTIGCGAVKGHPRKPVKVTLFQLGTQLRVKLLVILSRIFYKEFVCNNVLSAVKKYAGSRLAVTSCTACLLIVAFKVLWHIVMHHKGNVGFVDTHSEGVCCNHNIFAVVDEIVLVREAFGVEGCADILEAMVKTKTGGGQV